MILKSVTVKNFRSVKDETLECSDLLALVGANGSGKSALLKAINLFYSESVDVDPEDFYNEDATVPIEVSITFSNLSSDEKTRFAKYLRSDLLTVVRVLTLTDQDGLSAKYHGSTLQLKEFSEIRKLGTATLMKPPYMILVNSGNYPGLPRWTNLPTALDAMADWEQNNQDKCMWLRDDGQFFGFKSVAQGYLGRGSKFIFIPAVRDASVDAEESKGSPIAELMKLVVRSSFERRPEYQLFKTQTQQSYVELVEPSKIHEMDQLGKNLTETLKTYIPDAGVLLEWDSIDDLEFPLPKARVRLEEDGYECAVERTGHGLQRAFILTLLQHLALAEGVTATFQEVSSTEQEKAQPEQSVLPNLVLAIEEPELYQHPNRQRHFASILRKLATGAIPNVAAKTQVLYCTHSPHFVGLDRFNDLRIVSKKVATQGEPKITKLRSRTLDQVAEVIWNGYGKPSARFTGDSLRARLVSILNPVMNEGFFAENVVLVEGEGDKAAIESVAQLHEYYLESYGFSIIPCGGKSTLFTAAAIFKSLEIPTFCLWDGDKDKSEVQSAEENRRLLRLLGRTLEDWPDFVASDCACFKDKLELTMRREIGEDTFKELLQAKMQEHSMNKDEALKRPAVLAEILREAKKQGKKCESLEQILNKILLMSSKTCFAHPGASVSVAN